VLDVTATSLTPDTARLEGTTKHWTRQLPQVYTTFVGLFSVTDQPNTLCLKKRDVAFLQ